MSGSATCFHITIWIVYIVFTGSDNRPSCSMPGDNIPADIQYLVFIK